MLVAALAAGRHRLWLLVLLGMLLSLGANGPLSFALAPLLRTFRAPVKAFFLCALGLSLLAGLGVSRRTGAARAARWPAFVGGAWALSAALFALDPARVTRGLSALVTELEHPRALLVAQAVWPDRFLVAGLLALAASLALGRGERSCAWRPSSWPSTC